MSLLGAWSMWPEIKSQLNNVFAGVITYAVFSYFGAELAFYIGEDGMKVYFAGLLFVIAAIQIYPYFFSDGIDPKEKETISFWWVLFLGSIIGFIGGLYGIGAGVLMVPLFITVFKLKKDYARALSLAILLPPVSLGGFIRYNQESIIEWDLVLIMFFSYFFSNYFGAKFGSRVSSSSFQIVYALILVATAVVYLYV